MREPSQAREPDARASPVAPVARATPSPAPSFAELYRDSYADMVRLAVLLTGSVDIAQDVTQDAFVSVHRAWSRVREPRRICAAPSSTRARPTTAACSASAGRRHGPDRRAPSSAPTSSTCSRRCSRGSAPRSCCATGTTSTSERSRARSDAGPAPSARCCTARPRGFERSSKGDRKVIRDVIES